MLVKALRSRPEFSFVPVIFLTALGTDDDRIRGFRLGADDYMPKPFRFEELDLRVAKTLKHRAALEQSARDAISGSHSAPAADNTRASSDPGISGNLEQVGLPSLLTLLEMEKKSGIMVVRSDSTVARLFMRDGRVVKARVDGSDDPRNAECVYLVLSWSTGSFEFVPEAVDGDDEVAASTTHLLMEAARLQDEQSQL
jgi:CheY-like chemotaxis protein